MMLTIMMMMMMMMMNNLLIGSIFSDHNPISPSTAVCQTKSAVVTLWLIQTEKEYIAMSR